MAFRLPDTDPNLLFQAMRACWKNCSDQIFEAFFGLFRQLIQAEFARYTSEIALVDQLCAAARDEVRREFSHQKEKNFDYILLFRAIVYSHFSHTLKDQGVRKILQNAHSSMLVGPSGTGHDLCIVAFAALLTLPGDCRGKLLDFCLEAGALSVPTACFAAFNAHLARIWDR